MKLWKLILFSSLLIAAPASALTIHWGHLEPAGVASWKIYIRFEADSGYAHEQHWIAMFPPRPDGTWKVSLPIPNDAVATISVVAVGHDGLTSKLSNRRYARGKRSTLIPKAVVDANMDGVVGGHDWALLSNALQTYWGH